MSELNQLDFLEKSQERVNILLKAALPPLHLEPKRLISAMEYAVLNNGKRLRPALVYLTGEFLRINDSILDMIAVVIELIHSYSLVHDDLPAIDNDDLRRGQLSCHKAFDEATAILVGDALQNLAFEVLSHFRHPALSAEKQLELLQILTQACNSSGMVGGQAIDISVTGKLISLSELEDMHRRKTGALLLACVKMPAILSDLNPVHQEKLSDFGKNLGLAFQIRDDIIDIESSTEVLGKHQGADVLNHKPTYPAILGMASAKEKLQGAYLSSLACLEEFGPAADPLRELTQYIVTRVS